MDFDCIEAWLALPEFRVIDQVIGPKQLDLHLERRDISLMCPRCQTCCCRVKESRPRCLRDLPILERPVGSVRRGPSASTTGFERSTLGGVRATNWRVAMASPHARCFAGPLRGAGVAVLASSVEPLVSMNTPGARDTTTTR